MKTMNMPDHFGTGSALVEFLAGRMGAPECWPDDCKVKATVTRGRRTKHGTSGQAAASPSLTNTHARIAWMPAPNQPEQDRHE